MSRYARQYGKVLIYALPLLALIALLATLPQQASGATFANPFWSSTSTSPECIACSGCGCPRPGERLHGVSRRTGALNLGFHLFATPSLVGTNRFSLTWRSDVSGETQMGSQMIGSWEQIAAVVGSPSENDARMKYERA